MLYTFINLYFINIRANICETFIFDKFSKPGNIEKKLQCLVHKVHYTLLVDSTSERPESERDKNAYCESYDITAQAGWQVNGTARLQLAKEMFTRKNIWSMRSEKTIVGIKFHFDLERWFIDLV